MVLRLNSCAVTCVLAAMLSVFAMPAYAGLDIEAGRWRLELNNDFGVHQGGRDRSGDYSIHAVVEYEVPATSRVTLGLRLMPLFLYTQEDERDGGLLDRWLNDERYEDGGTVYGAGVGLSARIYQVKDEYRGFFGELAVTALGHGNEFNGNNSNLNFLTTVGVGYQFKSDWHLQVHYQHISNASLGSHNSGANSLGIGIGYRF